MFGISPLGWIHTLGSLPAIPLALYMLVRYGRITPRNVAGIAYFFSMLIGAVTVFLVARQAASYGIAVTPAEAFATGATGETGSGSMNAIRISLGSIKDRGRLQAGLQRLSHLLARRPDSFSAAVV